MPDPEDLANSGVHASYLSWLHGRPASGEVFVDTGEASPVAVKKIIWRPGKRERDAMRAGYRADIARVNKLFREGRSQEYAERMSELAADALKSVGVNPVTLEMLPQAQKSATKPAGS